jgi:hypothetical protein
MILGVNDGAGDGQFPWIPLLFFILIGLFCTDIACSVREVGSQGYYTSLSNYDKI